MPARTHDDVALASTLSPGDRLCLKRENHAEYHRLWHNAYSSTVWDRLTADAYCRSHRRAQSARPEQGGHTFDASKRVSGFVTNTSPAAYTLSSFKAGHNASFAIRPDTMAHPLLAKRVMHRQPLEYLAYIRPDTQTMAQTTRMLGTYETDMPHVRKAGIHMAHPGKEFHPDVHLTAKAYDVATHAHNTMVQSGRPLRPHSAHPVLSSRAAAQERAPKDATGLPDQGQPPPQPAQRPGSARVTARPAAGQLPSRPVSALARQQ